jgi:ABC-type bacteriocin/lantibiotic exporter with double-glycine peptidase domain
MVPLEDGGLQSGDRAGEADRLVEGGPVESRPVDALLRALLFLARQAGRPLGEPGVRRLAPVPPEGVDEQAFRTVGERLGLAVHAADLDDDSLDDVAIPFAVVADDRMAHVIVAGRGDSWVALDVVEGHARRLTRRQVMALGRRVLALREKPPSPSPSAWHAPLWRRLRPAILKLAAQSLAINLLGLATPLVMMLVLNRLAGADAPADIARMVTVLCLGLLVAYALDLGLRMLRTRLMARAGARLDMSLNGEVLHHVMRLPYRHFERTPAGIVAERLRQLDVLRGFLTGQLPALAVDVAFAFLFLAATFALDTTLGLIATLAVAPMLGVSLATRRSQRRLAEESFRAQAAKSSTLAEAIANAVTVKTLGLEPEIERRWQARVEQSAGSSERAGIIAGVVAGASGTVQLVASLAILAIGASAVLDQRLTVGALVGASMLAMRALQPMRQLAAAWPQLQSVAAAFARIDALMREAPEPADAGFAPPVVSRGEIVLDGVAYRADDTAPPILRGVDLAIAAGEIIGIIGPSGSGKTTIAHLLQGVIAPTGGRVMIDGDDIAHMPPAQLRACFGCVPQDIQLFAGTVSENIALGLVDKDPGRIVAAARFVGAHDFIQRLPQGYHTVLGEHGRGLSMGQRQLLCFARAVVRDPRILVLDEATSALDPAAEERLLRQLRANARGRTVIMITHRLAPLAIADRVALVMEGRIERVGPPSEIMAYARLRMAEASAGWTARRAPPVASCASGSLSRM